MNTRRAHVQVVIGGTDITADISGDVTGFTYTDNAGEEADAISLMVQNRTGKWLADWLPTEGDVIRASIVTEDWTGTLDCGDCIIDDVSFSGWPKTMSLGALALPMDEEFSDIPKNRTWSGATLSEIMESVAAGDNIPLDYQAAYNPTLEFVSQTEVSDKVFLHDLCEKYGLTMKLYSAGIVIFDMAEMERQDAAVTLTETDMLSFSCRSTIANTGYSACTARYLTKDGETLEYTHSIGGKTVKEYRHDAVLESLAEAQRVAESKLKELNHGETTFDCTLPGNTALVAGICVDIRGFGRFDGKYLVDQSSHSVGGGYTVSLNMHKVV